MSNDLLDQLAQSYVNAIVTGQREPNYLNVPYYLRPPAEALNQNALTEGTISNASWLDFNPMARSALDTFMEASGAAPSARLVDRLVKLQSPVLRPQSAYEWADWGAGAAADTIQTGLAGADLAALAPHIGRRAANSLMNELGQVDVWHGSPHRFDRVSHEKIGTGEGAQAFGWGTYYSDLREVASTYAKPNKVLFDGDAMDATEAYNKLGKEIGYDYLDGISRPGRVLNELIDNLAAGKKVNPYPKDSERFALYENLSKRLDYPEASTYRAQLFPGKDPSEYTFLDWYEPVDKAKREQIREVLGQTTDVVMHTGITAGDLYHQLEKHLGSDKEASLFLKRAGIDGIRYPTETLSGKGPKGGGAYNYVVFDENDVRLVQRESGGVVEDLLKNQQ